MDYFTRLGSKVSPESILSTSTDGQRATFKYRKTCGRCGGLGGGAQWQHTGWTCYECQGAGSWLMLDGKAYTAEKNAKLDAAQAKRDAAALEKANALLRKKQEEVAANLEQFSAENFDVVAVLDQETTNPFFQSLKTQLKASGKLSEAQVAAVRASVVKAAEQAAKASASVLFGVVKERYTATVTVEKVISFEGYGWRGEPCMKRLSMLRTDKGESLKFWGEVGDVGDVLVLKFTVKDHDDYKGEKQTIINRPVVVSVLSSETM